MTRKTLTQEEKKTWLGHVLYQKATGLTSADFFQSYLDTRCRYKDYWYRDRHVISKYLKSFASSKIQNGQEND